MVLILNYWTIKLLRQNSYKLILIEVPEMSQISFPHKYFFISFTVGQQGAANQWPPRPANKAETISPNSPLTVLRRKLTASRYGQSWPDLVNLAPDLFTKLLIPPDLVTKLLSLVNLMTVIMYASYQTKSTVQPWIGHSQTIGNLGTPVHNPKSGGVLTPS